MITNIEKNSFYKLDNISSIKNHIYTLNDIQVEENVINGSIDLELSYYNLEGSECNIIINLPFTLPCDNKTVDEINLVKINIFLIEGNGLNIEYELEINYQDKPRITKDSNENIGKVDVIDNIENESKSYEEIKESTKEYYEEMLEKNLRENVNIIETKTDNDVEDFLAFFENQTSFRLKCVHIDNLLELDDIAGKYNVSKEKLLAGYDEQTSKVIFTLD